MGRPRLRFAAAVASLLGAACSSSVASPGPDGGPTGLPGPPEWNRVVTPPADSVAVTARDACTYKAGALPAETQGQSTPSADQIPVDHIVVVMMENRSFDHYFQLAPSKGIDVEVAPAGFSNPDAMGKPVPIFHEPAYCFVDTAHGWDAVHAEIDSGKMDGFVKANTDTNHADIPPHGTAAMLSGNRAMGYYDEGDLPFTYWVAQNFAVADHYFASVPGPTWPNRMFLYAATSFGLTSNVPAGNVDKTLFDYLSERQVTWKIYYQGTAGFAIFINEWLSVMADHAVDFSQFAVDAANGTLPQVAFVDPNVGNESYTGAGMDPPGQDEHPPGDMQIGQNWIATVADTLAKSSAWSRSAMFVTYDEHGGLYDHVVPPKACVPDDNPVAKTPAFPDATFDSYGIRVPLMVISPFAKKHYAGHHVYDHTSVVRFIEARFTIPALTARDANAEAPWDLFDFTSAPNATAPAVPVPVVDQAKLKACEAIYNP